MQNSLAFLLKISQDRAIAPKPSRVTFLALFLLTLGVTLGWGGGFDAQAVYGSTSVPMAQAPAAGVAASPVQATLAQIDAAANKRDLPGVMNFYGSNFTHSDGLNRQTFERSLRDLWQRYASLNYQTEVKSWRQEGNAIVAETVTTITGVQNTQGRNLRLNATLTARQRFEGQKIVRQDILAEQSQITSGENPPTLEVNMPTQVRPGQEFNFDAIVREPLGSSVLLGAVVEEPVVTNQYFQPKTMDLEVLNAGGIFKMGRAPGKNNDSRWISAIVVREDGLTLVTQRLRVQADSRPAQ